MYTFHNKRIKDFKTTLGGVKTHLTRKYSGFFFCPLPCTMRYGLTYPQIKFAWDEGIGRKYRDWRLYLLWRRFHCCLNKFPKWDITFNCYWLIVASTSISAARDLPGTQVYWASMSMHTVFHFFCFSSQGIEHYHFNYLFHYTRVRTGSFMLKMTSIKFPNPKGNLKVISLLHLRSCQKIISSAESILSVA